ncbi:hypothetical protein ACP70R_033519 [Stipagrostis hirtigluma subsp. patula]
MDSRDHFDDSEWPEVKLINGYAVCMGYLLMGVKGLGMSVIAWITIVLLGGFVSDLGVKDYWCLTVIALIQATGFFIKENSSDFMRSSWHMLGSVLDTLPFRKRNKDFNNEGLSWWRDYILPVIHLLALGIILSSLTAVYVFGYYISTGVSLWRLIKHDFDNANGGGNLKRSLDVLYGMAVAQGLLFNYEVIYAVGVRTGRLRSVANVCSLDSKLVARYLDTTLAGCLKDPSFGTGRNFVTYGVDLIDSKPTGDFMAGVRLLGTLLTERNDDRGRLVLAKSLLSSSVSWFSLHRLLEALGPRSPYSSKTREHAAKIVVMVADRIHLEQHPGGIQCISSLLNTFEEYSWQPEEHERSRLLNNDYERDWMLKGYERDYQLYGHERPGSLFISTSEERESSNLRHGYNRLVIQGLRILREITVNEDNCRAISDIQGLLFKIMVLLASDKLYRNHDDEWCIMALESLELASQLMSTTHGNTGTKLQVQISSNTEAIISTLESILECGKCKVLLKRQAVQVVLDLSVDTPSIIASGSSNSTILIWMLLHIFLLPDDCFPKISCPVHRLKKRSDIRNLAREELQAAQSIGVVKERSDIAGEELQAAESIGVVLCDLTKALVDAGNNANRVQAAEILEHLCRHYTKDFEYLKELKKAMVDVMPKLLKEMLGYGSTGEEIQIVTEGNNGKQPSTDSNGGVSQGSDHEDTTSSHQQNGNQHEGVKLLQAQYDLCWAIWIRWINNDSDLTRQLNEIAEMVCLEQGKPVKDFDGLVDEARVLLRKHKAEELARARAASSSRET